MNITSIHLYSPLDVADTEHKHAELALTGIDPTQSYIIKSVTGLDADEITTKLYGFSPGTTTRFNSMGLPKRNVSMLIRLNPQYAADETPSSLRDAFYRMIAYSRRGDIELRFMDGDTHVASLTGHITRFEASIFSPEPEIQISFECKDPFLRAPEVIIPIISHPDHPSWYDGVSTAPSGVVIVITFTSDYSSPFTVQGIYGTTVAPFVVQQSFLAGDSLWINSGVGTRFVLMIRGFLVTQLADKLTASSIWPMSFPGDNHISFSTSEITLASLQYQPNFWGI